MSHVPPSGLSPLARLATAILAAILATGSAQAQAIAGQGDPTAPAGVPPADAFAQQPVDEHDLGTATGRENVGAMIASAAQRNTVANNSVTGVSTTGNVGIDGNAFQNLQGLAVISANSGNNVAMNAAMNVTVNLAPR